MYESRHKAVIPIPHSVSRHLYCLLTPPAVLNSYCIITWFELYVCVHVEVALKAPYKYLN